jgi:3-methyladenine DNA glycosylase AlkD
LARLLWPGWKEGKMETYPDLADPGALAAGIDAEIRALPVRNTPNVRAVRRRYSHQLRDASPAFMLDLVRELVSTCGYRGIAYELLLYHRPAFERLGETEIEELGQGIDSWWAVDSFARLLSGPAWLRRQVPDQLIHRWAHSEDRWWRRAALVSTVALNVRTPKGAAGGGRGDTARTLAVCRLLADDHDDMVVKALSWALRELVPHDPVAVRTFLAEHDDVLAARIKREVRNKLDTGLKNPKRKGE